MIYPDNELKSNTIATSTAAVAKGDTSTSPYITDASYTLCFVSLDTATLNQVYWTPTYTVYKFEAKNGAAGLFELVHYMNDINNPNFSIFSF